MNVMPHETKAYMDFVCVNAVGALITPDAITSQFRKLLDRNNLPHIKFHAFRHSCISLLANNTAFSMKQIQDYAGHSDFLTTFNVYSHSDDSAKRLKWTISPAAFLIFSVPTKKNKQMQVLLIMGAPAYFTYACLLLLLL
ncbi:tyrosine-type recombinase/integrase [Ruminococcus sp.]